MDLSTQRLMMGAAGSAAPAYVEDVFSTWLYTGNGSTQTITNGIDLSGKGGLVWIKNRDTFSFAHQLYDTARGAGYLLNSGSSDAQAAPGGDPATGASFTSSGFSVGSSGGCNYSGVNFASWTFRKAPGFFDVVTYTGTGSSGLTVSHSLGSVPGCIAVKRTDSTGAWRVFHRSLGATQNLELDSTNAAATNTAIFNDTAPTSTQFTLGNNSSVNASGGTYVAYLFAHDEQIFGEAGDQSVIKCGSYTGNGSATGPVIDLGWEPQWVMIKATGLTRNWVMCDVMRGMPVDSNGALLAANLSDAEITNDAVVRVTSTGFQPRSTSSSTNDPSQNYIYIAIRRGPMKTPTDATKVFSTFARTGTGASAVITTPGFTVDLILGQDRPGTTFNGCLAVDRLRGAGKHLRTESAGQESSNIEVVSALDSMTGFTLGFSSGLNQSGVGYANWILRRAPGFFDMVAYTGNGSNRTINHNLGVIPEMMIVKCRSTTESWAVYNAAMPATSFLQLNDNVAERTTGAAWWNSTRPTASVFSVGTDGAVNANGATYINYIFASLPGISKVGSYIGTGTTSQINCGFTNGARFVLIRRYGVGTGGDWYVWDAARGIVGGNDPYLLLNSNAAEVTNTDYIDSYSAGFEISSTAPAAINASGGSFIFLAIA